MMYKLVYTQIRPEIKSRKHDYAIGATFGLSPEAVHPWQPVVRPAMACNFYNHLLAFFGSTKYFRVELYPMDNLPVRKPVDVDTW